MAMISKKFKFFSLSSVSLAVFLLIGSFAIITQEKLFERSSNFALVHMGFTLFLLIYSTLGLFWVARNSHLK